MQNPSPWRQTIDWSLPQWVTWTTVAINIFCWNALIQTCKVHYLNYFISQKYSSYLPWLKVRSKHVSQSLIKNTRERGWRLEYRSVPPPSLSMLRQRKAGARLGNWADSNRTNDCLAPWATSDSRSLNWRTVPCTRKGLKYSSRERGGGSWKCYIPGR